MRHRGRSFLRLLEAGVFAHPDSPFARLFAHAGITFSDAAEMVADSGVEGALERWHLAGVYATLDEFKGQLPIRRGSFSFDVSAADFDNRSATPHFEARTGGSRGAGRLLLVDLDLLAHEAAYDLCASAALGVGGRARALWRPVPPGSAGMKTVLRWTKARLPLDRWFSQSPIWDGEQWRHTVFTAATVAASRAAGVTVPWPEHVPSGGAATVARWLASARGRSGGLLDTNAASAVRVCHAAEADGLDISGSFFRIGGEPFTEGKAAIIARVGARAACHYSMSEAGRLGNACGRPAARDEVHVAVDKMAVVARDIMPAGSDVAVPALYLTTLHGATSKIMINVESGDYGTLSTRDCGCLFDDLGYTLHLHGIRSYEKLTSEGMHFVGALLLRLIDTVLPGRFGGGALDYQMVEEEHHGVPRVVLVVSPRLGPVDTGALVSDVLEHLSKSGPAARMMAGRWRDAETLQVVRREPYVTREGKVQALHVAGKTERVDG